MHERGKVKKALKNKIGITIYSLTLWLIDPKAQEGLILSLSQGHKVIGIVERTLASISSVK